MIKCDNQYLNFKYYNENNEHEFIDIEKASNIIEDLIHCPEFQCDSTVLQALYMAMRKLQGFSDEEIYKLCK